MVKAAGAFAISTSWKNHEVGDEISLLYAASKNHSSVELWLYKSRITRNDYFTIFSYEKIFLKQFRRQYILHSKK